MVTRFFFRQIRRFWWLILLLVGGFLLWQQPWLDDEDQVIRSVVQGKYFDFVSWELDALFLKGGSALADGEVFLTEEAKKQIVLDYLALLSETRQLEAEIEAIYTDPTIEDADSASEALQMQRDQNRAQMETQQPLAEHILQEQVAVILEEEGFSKLENVWPPVSANMTPLPLMLITSPRTHIEQIHAEPLQHGLTVPELEEIEATVLAELDQSAFVTRIGGLGIFPSMIVETSNINFLADVIAHEWAHHWLTLKPLGFSYFKSADLRTINETVASILGTEIGERVIERYYPEHVPEPRTSGSTVTSTESEPQQFDFRIEMRVTRLQADELLADGKIEEAEAYMEERRKTFWDNGYRIRKLNQAYFAFHGAYADTGGATGSDPVGPLVVQLRSESESVGDFLRKVAPITSFEELSALKE